MAAIVGGARKLGSGEFAEWTFAGILTYKPRCIEFQLGDKGDGAIPEKKEFIEWIQYNNVEIAVDEKTGSAE